MKVTTLLAAGTSALGFLTNLVAATTYNFALQYQGDSFFDGWTFYDHFDNLTNGDANFVGQSAAQKSNLAFVNDAGNAIMRVDNTSSLKFGDKRDTIHITSKDLFTVGTVWIADFLHVPFGCSTWPAFWSVAPNWPAGGEIDTFEGINDVKNNRMTLHTEPGCVIENATMTSTIINSTDCNFELNGNEGCVITDPAPSSYGQAFADAGGGIYITEFSADGISVWFFNRSSIPSVLQGNASSFDTKSLGTPVSNWPSTGCDVNTFFRPQQLVFDITLCGDLAGLSSVFAETCPGDCYVDWVLGSPSNFDNAYFEVQSVKIYESGENDIILASSSLRQQSAPWTALTMAFGSTVLVAAVLQISFSALW